MKYLSFSLAKGKKRAGVSHFYLSFSNMGILGHCKRLLERRFRPLLENDVQETDVPPEEFTPIEWSQISAFLELIERGER